MKKIIITDYGTVDVFKEIQTELPAPKPTEVIVKVAATGIDDSNVVLRKNGPFPTMPEEFRPTLPLTLGYDFSGIVTQIGDNVTNFQVGDHVVGFTKNGTYAEYLLLDQSEQLVKIPKDLDLIPAGGLILSAITAWAAVVTNGKVQKNQRVLIHGGAGGVGSMAIQIAKSFGAYIITTASAKHNQYLKELGADQIIDYQTEDFTQIVKDIDLVVNLTGPKTLEQSYQVIKPGGRLTSVNGVPDQTKAKELGINAIYSMGFPTIDILNKIVNLYENNQLKISVNQTYPFTLDGIKQSHLDFEKGSNQGKRIIVFNK